MMLLTAIEHDLYSVTFSGEKPTMASIAKELKHDVYMVADWQIAKRMVVSTARHVRHPFKIEFEKENTFWVKIAGESITRGTITVNGHVLVNIDCAMGSLYNQVLERLLCTTMTNRYIDMMRLRVAIDNAEKAKATCETCQGVLFKAVRAAKSGIKGHTIYQFRVPTHGYESRYVTLSTEFGRINTVFFGGFAYALLKNEPFNFTDIYLSFSKMLEVTVHEHFTSNLELVGHQVYYRGAYIADVLGDSILMANEKYSKYIDQIHTFALGTAK